MDQTVLNYIIGAVFSVTGWVLKTLWDALKDLQKADTQLAEKVNSIELLVAGQYVKRDDFEKFCNAVFLKLDKISDKIDRKVDK